MAPDTARTVLITGCSSGIGLALARAFRAAGRRVVATARTPEDIDLEPSDDLLTLALDVTDPLSIHNAVARATAWASHLDILVNNAGFALIGPVAELEPDDLRRQLETNVVGPVALLQAVVPDMIRRGRGVIVNVGSVSGLTTTPFGGAYCASKAALHALSDALRMEVARFGVDVVVVQPGAIASRFGDASAVGLERYRSPESWYHDVADSIVRRARMSQDRPTDTDAFARHVVDRVLRADPPARIRSGRGSRLLPLVGRLPRRLRDNLLRTRFGLQQAPRGTTGEGPPVP
jgi:NAD(P)-dependent dehydrogenase (short-subunit alcohol dehydrogenase family)